MPLFRSCAVGPGLTGAAELVQWSATFDAAVTLNCRAAAADDPVPTALEVEFMPELAPAELLPGAEALALAPV